jgi:hypothetical protein
VGGWRACLCRTWREGAEGRRHEVIAVTYAGEQPTPGSVNRLTHEYGLKDHLDAAWALRPLDLVHERGQAILLLEPTRGEPLHRQTDLRQCSEPSF